MTRRTRMIVSAFALAAGPLGLTAAVAADQSPATDGAEFVQAVSPADHNRVKHVIQADQTFHQKFGQLREQQQQAVAKREHRTARKLMRQMQALQEDYRTYRLKMHDQMTPREVIDVREALQDLREMRLQPVKSDRTRSQAKPIKLDKQNAMTLQESKSHAPATRREVVEMQRDKQAFETVLQRVDERARNRKPVEAPSLSDVLQQKPVAATKQRSTQSRKQN